MSGLSGTVRPAKMTTRGEILCLLTTASYASADVAGEAGARLWHLTHFSEEKMAGVLMGREHLAIEMIA